MSSFITEAAASKLSNAFATLIKDEKVVPLGACGGVGGDDFDMDLTTNPVLVKVEVSYANDLIGGMKIGYVYQGDLKVHWLGPFGESKFDRKYSTGQYDFQGFDLTKVEGTIADIVISNQHYQLVTSITFTTTKPDEKTKTFGTPYGKKFTLSGTDDFGRIVGFFGRSGYALDAIGVKAYPLSN